MESTAQYWKPVWLDLEPHFKKLHLAQAQSNRAPKGRKNDFADAKRLARRLLAGEPFMGYVSGTGKRPWGQDSAGRIDFGGGRGGFYRQLGERLWGAASIQCSR